MKKGFLIIIISILILIAAIVAYLYYSNNISITKCVKEGAGVGLVFDKEIKTCCPGLKAIQLNYAPNLKGQCEGPTGNPSICMKCGDSLCGENENWCNCPEDCEKPCAKEGESISSVYQEGYLEKCCNNLIDFPSGMNTAISIGNKCYETGKVSGLPVSTCLKCGDGICQDIENACNCLQDCKNGEHSMINSTEEFCKQSYSNYCNNETLETKDLPLCKLCK